MNVLQKLALRMLPPTTPITKTMWRTIIGSGVFASTNNRKLEEYYYGTVFACIDAIATAVSNTRFHLYQVDKQGNKTERDDHDAFKLLQKPNDFQTAIDLFYIMSAHLEAFGRTFVMPEITKGEMKIPTGLYVVNPQLIEIKSDPIKLYSSYTLRVGTKTETKKLNELINVWRPHPFNQADAVSTIQMARYEANGDLNSLDYNETFFKQGARPSGVLTTEQLLSDEAFEELKTQWKETYEGKHNQNKTIVLEGGMKYEQMSLNQKDMDFIEQRRLSRDQILSIFRVPKSVLAIADDVNRANADAQEYIFAKYVVKPRLEMIFDKLNTFFLPMFKGTEGMFLEYENPVPEDKELALREKEASVGKWRTRNEIREEENREPVDGGDELYVDGMQMSLSEIEEEKKNPKQDPNDNNSDNNDNPNDNSGGKNDDSDKNGDSKPKDGQKDTSADNAVKKDLSPTPLSEGDSRRESEKSADHSERGGESQEETQQKKEKAIKYTLTVRRFIRNRTRYLDKAEKMMARKIKAHFTTLELNIGKKKGVELMMQELMPDMDRWAKALATIVFEYQSNVAEDGKNQAARAFDLNPDFSLEHSGAIKYLQNEAQKMAFDVKETMLNRAREVIAESLKDDKVSLRKIGEDLKSVYKDEKQWRVDRIARTETAKAYHVGSKALYEQSGMVSKYLWITVDPCEICAAYDGKVYEANYLPQEPPVHPNCRCEVVPMFE